MDEKKASSDGQLASKVDTKNATLGETNTSQQQQNNPITRKLNKILESRIENDKV